jgi:hypothetical protein
MISPEIWTDLKFVRLSLPQRLLYIGLISNADDDGRLRGEAEYLKMIIFPSDNISPNAIEDMLKHLDGLIIRYEVNGNWYIQHPNWNKHQYIEKRRPSLLPAPVGYHSPTYPLPVGERSPLNPKEYKEKGGKETPLVTCPDCKGKGGYYDGRICLICKGKGTVWKVDLPLIIDNLKKREQ